MFAAMRCHETLPAWAATYLTILLWRNPKHQAGPVLLTFYCTVNVAKAEPLLATPLELTVSTDTK